MSYKLLIDECLSPELVKLAIAAGYVESTCVRNRQWLGLKDHELIRRVIAADMTFVTHNASDFRGSPAEPGRGLYSKESLHAGLICLNADLPMSLDRQVDLFRLALQELAAMPDLVNRALEIFEREDGEVTGEVYEIPDGGN